MKNKAIAEILTQLADLLEIKGELPFKINAYRRASRVIEELQQDIELVWQEKQLRQLPGIGEAMAKKIDEYLTTGQMSKLEALKQEIPDTLVQLLKIQNLGPKTLALAHHKLGVNNLSDLYRVMDDGSLAELPGMGPKKIENLRKGIELFQSAAERISIGIAYPLIEQIIQALRDRVRLERISPAGSARRMRETVGDLDLLVATDYGTKVVNAFVQLPMVQRVLAAGDTKGSVIIENGIQVDLRAVPLASFGAALQYFTGSQAHNIKLRGIARRQGLKISEYGIFRDEQMLGGATEEEIYQQLNLPWIPPELREDRGEIEAAAENKLPKLIEMRHLRGDLHVHSNYSDGHAPMEAMVTAAKALGYHYLAFCDHSQSAHYAHGLTPERLRQQIDEIRALNKKYPDFKILTGTEVDILADGRLDFPDDLLQELDIVVASIHSGFKQKVTERIIAALENPLVDILGHPTGRLISQREGYEVDLAKIFDVAARTGTALEINAHPARLDLSDTNARLAIEKKIMLAINTDAHEPEQLKLMRFGVGTARRGWVTPPNVLNSKTIEELLAWKKQRLNQRRK